MNASISQVTESGLVVKLADMFDATADLMHVGKFVKNPEEMETLFKVDQKVKVKIIAVKPSRKLISVSLNPSIVNQTSCEMDTQVDIGTILSLKVERVDEDQGLLMLPTEPLGLIAYAHKSRISDSSFTKFDKKHKVGSVHQGRVVSLSPFDGILSFSLQQSVLNVEYARYQDLKPGMSVKGTIVEVAEKGLTVRLTETIRGFIPKLHMSDVALSDPSKLFKLNAPIKCQVWACQPEERKLILTHKKSLMANKLPILDSYESAQKNDIHMGVISSICDFGCFVMLHNNLKGMAHVSELCEEFIKHPSELFRVGQAVKCRITDIEQDRLKLSFKTIGFASSSLEGIKIGQVVSCQVTGKTSTHLKVLVNNTAMGNLEFAHLTDIMNSDHIKKLAECIQKDQILEECVVIGKDAKRNILKLTRKPCLVDAAKSTSVFDWESVELGMGFPGYIVKVLENAVLVEFVGVTAWCGIQVNFKCL